MARSSPSLLRAAANSDDDDGFSAAVVHFARTPLRMSRALARPAFAQRPQLETSERTSTSQRRTAEYPQAARPRAFFFFSKRQGRALQYLSCSSLLQLPMTKLTVFLGVHFLRVINVQFRGEWHVYLRDESSCASKLRRLEAGEKERAVDSRTERGIARRYTEFDA